MLVVYQGEVQVVPCHSKWVFLVACSLETASFVAKGTQKRSFLWQARKYFSIEIIG